MAGNQQQIWSSQEIYDYVSKNGMRNIPKNAMVTKDIPWAELFKRRSTNPGLVIFQNLHAVSNTLQTAKDIYWSNSKIKIESGFRYSAQNIASGNASSTSLHLEGLAIDFKLTNVNTKQIINKLNPILFGELESPLTHTLGGKVHIGLPSLSSGYLKRKNIKDIFDPQYYSKIAKRFYDSPGYPNYKSTFSMTAHNKVFGQISSKKGQLTGKAAPISHKGGKGGGGGSSVNTLMTEDQYYEYLKNKFRDTSMTEDQYTEYLKNEFDSATKQVNYDPTKRISTSTNGGKNQTLGGYSFPQQSTSPQADNPTLGKTNDQRIAETLYPNYIQPFSETIMEPAHGYYEESYYYDKDTNTLIASEEYKVVPPSMSSGSSGGGITFSSWKDAGYAAGAAAITAVLFFFGW